MAQLKHIFRGESLTVLLTFPEAYDMARIEKHEIYIGATAYTGVVSGKTIELKLTSEQTDAMFGKQLISLWLDDSVLGVRKPYCGEIIVSNSNAKPANASTSSVSDIIIPIVISETSITVGDILYNYVKGDKGDKGDPFLYEDFTPEQIALLQKPATDAVTAVNEAEALRVTAESTRVQNEQARVTAEGTRQSNETARVNAEDDRDEAEALRLSAEITRGQNEQGRVTAEGLRVTAEQTRQTNTATAITNANNAANNANTKAGLADAAATNANTKAGLANTAATLAIEVAEHPDTIINEYWHKWNTTTNAYETTGIKAKGDTGKSAYQSYYDTTTDNPKLTENQWGNLMTGILNVLNSI